MITNSNSSVLTMRSVLTWFIAATVMCAWGCVSAQIRLAGISESSGTGAGPGQNFKNGYRLAVEEINAAGGVLGQTLVLTQYDIDTNPGAATDAARKAVAGSAFAIIGPVFSGLTLAAMQETAQSKTPHFTGGEAASLSQKYHPSLLRTSSSQLGTVPQLGSLVANGLRVKNVGLLWIDNAFGRDGKAALEGSLVRRNVSIAFDAAVKPGETDFGRTIANLKSANVDVLVLYLTELESIGALKELRRQGFAQAIVGDGLIASKMVINGADGAAEGVLAHMAIFTDSPNSRMQAFVKRYVQKYGAPPDHNSAKGYFAVQMIRAGVELAGVADKARFLDMVKNTSFDTKRFPELINSVSYDLFGDIHRGSQFVVIRGGQHRLIASRTAAENSTVELPGGRSVALNSNEFRAALQDTQNNSATTNSKTLK